MSPGPAEQRTAVVIDDSDLVLELVCEALASRGWRCLSALDGASGVDLVLAHEPDVVLCDLHMPGLDGLGVIRELAAHGSAAPVVILSLDSDLDAIQAAMRAGAYDYTVKTGDEEAIRRIATRAAKAGRARAAQPRTEPRPFETIADRLGARLLRRRALAGGVSASVQALDLERPDGTRERVVIRVHPSTATEARVLASLAGTGLPVLDPLLVDVSGELLSEPLLVLPFVRGTSRIEGTDAELEGMADLLARLHALDAATLDLPALPRRDDPLAELADWLPLEHAGATAALEAAGANLVRRDSLVHGDFWTGNLLWRDGRIAALVDWEDAARGDPLSDLAGARQELLWSHGPEAVARFTAGYAARRGPIDDRSLALWDAWVGSAALVHMEAWDLDPDDEDARREQSGAWIAAALDRLR